MHELERLGKLSDALSEIEKQTQDPLVLLEKAKITNFLGKSNQAYEILKQVEKKSFDTKDQDLLFGILLLKAEIQIFKSEFTTAEKILDDIESKLKSMKKISNNLLMESSLN